MFGDFIELLCNQYVGIDPRFRQTQVELQILGGGGMAES